MFDVQKMCLIKINILLICQQQQIKSRISNYSKYWIKNDLQRGKHTVKWIIYLTHSWLIIIMHK